MRSILNGCVADLPSVDADIVQFVEECGANTPFMPDYEKSVKVLVLYSSSCYRVVLCEDKMDKEKIIQFLNALPALQPQARYSPLKLMFHRVYELRNSLPHPAL